MREVCELHLGHRPFAGDRKAQRHTGDRRLRQRRVDDAGFAEFLVQTVGDEEHAAFRTDVLAEHHHALVALHLLGEAGAEGGDHVHLFDFNAGRGLDRLRRIHPVDIRVRALGRSVGRLDAFLGRLRDLVLDPLLELRDVLRAEDLLLEQALLEALEAVVLGQLVDLLLHAVAALVVLGRVRAEAVDHALDEGWPLACPGAGDRLFGDVVARDRVATVHGHPWKAVAGSPLRDVLDRVLLAHRGRDRKPVVLAHEDLWQLVYRREVESLVRVALRAGAFAVAGHQHLVGAIHLQRVCDAGPAHHLRRNRRSARGDVQARVGEVARSLLAS